MDLTGYGYRRTALRHQVPQVTTSTAPAPAHPSAQLTGEALRLLLRYTQSLMTQMAQAAVCNRHHSIDRQLCRWFLSALDRLPGRNLKLSHETIAHLLGVRREGVSEAAGKLQKLGAIEYRHGHVTVLDDHVGFDLMSRYRWMVDGCMYSTDYPHSVTLWPNSREHIATLTAGLTATF